MAARAKAAGDQQKALELLHDKGVDFVNDLPVTLATSAGSAKSVKSFLLGLIPGIDIPNEASDAYNTCSRVQRR